MTLPEPTLRLIFLDLLFLALAGTMAFWFRAWLKEQKRDLDRRLASLESQQQGLLRLGERLSGLCRTLEQPAPPAAEAVPRPRGSAVSTTRAGTGPWTGGATGERGAARPAAGAGSIRQEDSPREAYRQARELLDQGLSPAEISRRVGLRITEVDVLRRMREGGRRR